jgi:uncharacterized membrane protein
MKLFDKRDIRWAHVIFLIGAALKALNATIEIVGGILLYFLSHEKIVQIVLALTSEELSEDPRDRIANYLISSAQQFSVSAQTFGIIYLLSHGIIKLFLIAGMLKRKLWAYPLSIGIFSLFILYQLYKFFYNHSPWLISLSILDLVMIVATLIEWRRLSKDQGSDRMLAS